MALSMNGDSLIVHGDVENSTSRDTGISVANTSWMPSVSEKVRTFHLSNVVSCSEAEFDQERTK
jgi:hypothetical protein